jgi:hypothetical protein
MWGDLVNFTLLLEEPGFKLGAPLSGWEREIQIVGDFPTFFCVGYCVDF